MPNVDRRCDSIDHWRHKCGGLEGIELETASLKLDIVDKSSDNDRQVGKQGTDEMQPEVEEGKGRQDSSFSSW